MVFTPPHKNFLIISFLFFVSAANGQDKTAVKASVDKNQIVIGEQIHFTLQAHFPSNELIRFFNIDSIPHFEIVDRKKIDTTDNNEGIELMQSFTLTSFDSGHWVIPPFELSGDALYTDSIPMDVGFSPFDPAQDYHDIKDILDVQIVEKKETPWYWYAAASAILIAAIIYLLAGKKKKPVVAKVPPVDPFTEAMQGLEKLRKENPASKLFYTRVVDIFRLYISRKKGIASQQKTTNDLVVQLGTLKLATEDFNRLAQVLRMSDFVKFAKYEPAETDKTDSLDTIKHSIGIIEKTSANTVAGGQKV